MKSQIRKRILGTDWWTDCDDCVALRLLCTAHRRGEIELTGVVVNACMPVSASSLSAFLVCEGLAALPVGIDLAATDYGGCPPYQARLAAMPHSIQKNEACEDGVRLYRRLLVQTGESELVEIGYPQVLAALLASPPDEFSPLGGAELVRRHVKKLWMMAGKWDEAEGHENNFTRAARSRRAGHALCAAWPAPVTFLGWEIGRSVLTGARNRDINDPLYAALCDHGSPEGRCSWDPMAALLAVKGGEAAAGYRFAEGRAAVDPLTGANTFETFAGGPHRYVIKAMPDRWYEDEIEKYL